MKNLVCFLELRSPNAGKQMRLEKKMRGTEKTIKRVYISVYSVFLVVGCILATQPMYEEEVPWFPHMLGASVYVAELIILSVSLIASMCLLNSKLKSIAGDDFRKEKSSITTLATILVVTYACVTLFAGLDRFLLGDIQKKAGAYYA